ncbi:DUF1848 family protein [Pelomyxa schiedti]|nr:DUF1848 family protein [Pelomyxa schiedti]
MAQQPEETWEVISCSRRTDIPAFYMDWVLERIKEGFVTRSRYSPPTVTLRPPFVRAFVWWSKDFSKWLQCFNDPVTHNLLAQYDAHCFNFTLNSPSILEPGLRCTFPERLEQLSQLVRLFGPESVSLRFDPIVFYKNHGDDTVYDNLSHFSQICEAGGKLGLKKITFAFCIPYKTVVPRMAQAGIELIDPPLIEKERILDNLIGIAATHGLTLHPCRMPEVLGHSGLTPGSCVDGNQVNAVLKARGLPLLTHTDHDPWRRDACHCSKSMEIGSYDKEFACAHRCIYCCANPLNRNGSNELF